MKLSAEEQALLNGQQGDTLQKVMRTLVLYGEAVGAERLVDIEGDGHFSISGSTPGIDAPIELLEELVEAGLKTKFPFTLDPRDPLDFHNLGVNTAQQEEFKKMFQNNGRYQRSMKKLGLQHHNAYTCSPYVFETGNIPKYGQILAWSESSCVVYANSALGARTNRNAAIIDLLSNIVGKTPLFGLLTAEGRQANWRIEIKTEKLPPPQLLGAVIGEKVQDGIPFIVGLDQFLGKGINERTRDYLKEMGAACAAIGAVALYHVEGITPEAIDNRETLLQTGYKSFSINDSDLHTLLESYPVLWKNPNAAPQRAMIGCPHLSLRELHEWTERICSSLQVRNSSKVAIDTVLVAPPDVLKEFRHQSPETYEKLLATGARLSATCLEAFMNNSLCASEAVITNSNKLRAFTTARLVLNAQLAEIIASGQAPKSLKSSKSIKKNNEVKPVIQKKSLDKKELIFKGRPVFPIKAKAQAIVSHKGFNSLASFYDTVLTGTDKAICGDHDSPETHGKTLTGTILCIPNTIGSTSAGAIWELIARQGLAPAAVLFSKKIDSLAAAGFALSEVWAGYRIGAIDDLGGNFLEMVREGDTVEIETDGSVYVSPPEF